MLCTSWFHEVPETMPFTVPACWFRSKETILYTEAMTYTIHCTCRFQENRKHAVYFTCWLHEWRNHVVTVPAGFSSEESMPFTVPAGFSSEETMLFTVPAGFRSAETMPFTVPARWFRNTETILYTETIHCTCWFRRTETMPFTVPDSFRSTGTMWITVIGSVCFRPTGTWPPVLCCASSSACFMRWLTISDADPDPPDLHVFGPLVH